MAGRVCSGRHSDRLLCVTCLADRWGVHYSTVCDQAARGDLPRPGVNAHRARGWLWHVDAVEAFERGLPFQRWDRGTTQPTDDGGQRRRLEAVSS